MARSWQLTRALPSAVQAVVAAVVGPALVTLLALFPEHFGVASAALAYVLAVAAATTVGGLRSGLAASLLSFVALHYFFTPPLGFGVPRTPDLVALLAFLIVSVVIGLLLSSAFTQRMQSERRAQEAQLLHHVAARLLAGESVDRVLRRFAQSVTVLLDLKRCQITTRLSDSAVVVRGKEPEGDHDRRQTFLMVASGYEVGEILVVSDAGHPLTEDEVQVMKMFADQLALALESVRLASEAKAAQLDAEASKARAALFSSVTHDLRTPLASILASATSLRDPRMSLEDEDRRELLDAICQETERLNKLVGNLLDLARMRAGALTPRKIATSLEELAQGVVVRLAPVLKDHPVSLRVDADLPDFPFDVVQLDQLLTNLLENAARFAPPGTPIHISGARTDGRARIEIIDRGPGIAVRDRERVFEPFVKGADPLGGTGLGLAIAKAIVEAHGGRIWIVDSPPGGTAVVFELPIEADT